MSLWFILFFFFVLPDVYQARLQIPVPLMSLCNTLLQYFTIYSYLLRSPLHFFSCFCTFYILELINEKRHLLQTHITREWRRYISEWKMPILRRLRSTFRRKLLQPRASKHLGGPLHTSVIWLHFSTQHLLLQSDTTDNCTYVTICMSVHTLYGTLCTFTW